jgi:hypothetical protein
MLSTHLSITAKLPWKGFPRALAIWAIAGWSFLAASRESPPPTVAFILPVGVDVICVLYMGFRIIGRRDYKAAQGIIIVILAALMILQGFTIAYYAIGNAKNFSQPLTRLDALYVALGNLSTAGTGNIYPISEGARAWVTGQYCADIAFLVGLVSFLLWRAGKSN